MGWKLLSLPFNSVGTRLSSSRLRLHAERALVYLQQVEAITKIHWTDNITYGDVHLQEIEQCTFEASNPDMLLTLFGLYEQEAEQLLERGLVLPSLITFEVFTPSIC